MCVTSAFMFEITFFCACLHFVLINYLFSFNREAFFVTFFLAIFLLEIFWSSKMHIFFLLSTVLITRTCCSSLFKIISEPPADRPTILSSNRSEIYDTTNNLNIGNSEAIVQRDSYHVIFQMTIGNIVVGFSGFTILIILAVYIYQKNKPSDQMAQNIMPQQLELVNFLDWIILLLLDVKFACCFI